MRRRNVRALKIAAVVFAVVLLAAGLPTAMGTVFAEEMTEAVQETATEPATSMETLPAEESTSVIPDILADVPSEQETAGASSGDRQILEEAVYQASLLSPESYSQESFQALQDEIAAADALLKSDTATAVQLQQQLYQLTLAYSRLENGFFLKPLPSLRLQEEDSLDAAAETKSLEDGTYEIDGVLRHASADQNSMGNNAIAKPLQLVVENGKATLRFEMVPLTASLGKNQFTGYLYHMDYYPGWKGGDTGYKAPIGVDPVAATVEEYYESLYDDYNDPKTGLDKNIRGKLYPHYISLPVDLFEEEIWVQVYVPVMEAISEGSGTQFAKLQLDWNSVKLKSKATDEAENDIKHLSDGIYKVTGNMVKVNKTDASMANDAINHAVKLTVKDGTYHITLNFKGLTVGTQLGYLGTLHYFKTGYDMDVYGAPQGSTAAVTVDSYQTTGDGSRVSDVYGTDYPDKVTFELIPEALEDGCVPLQVFVPIMEAISAGSGTQPVFLVLDWNTIKKTTAEDADFEDAEGENEGTSSAVELTDKATGVRVSAGAGILPEGVKLVVRPITQGSEYNTVKSNMFISGNNFVLYDIGFTDTDGNEVQPSGRVTVSLPLPSGWGSTGLSVYHFSDSGSASPIVGTAADGSYTFSSASFSKFALVERKGSGLPGSSSLPGSSTLPGSGLSGTGTGSTPTLGTSGSKLSSGTIAKTGDQADPSVWIALMIAAAAAICLLFACRQKA